MKLTDKRLDIIQEAVREKYDRLVETRIDLVKYEPEKLEEHDEYITEIGLLVVDLIQLAQSGEDHAQGQ